jgi:hypothetical protein
VGKNITLPVMYQITFGKPDCFIFNAKFWKTGHVTWWFFGISALPLSDSRVFQMWSNATLDE